MEYLTTSVISTSRKERNEKFHWSQFRQWEVQINFGSSDLVFPKETFRFFFQVACIKFSRVQCESNVCFGVVVDKISVVKAQRKCPFLHPGEELVPAARSHIKQITATLWRSDTGGICCQTPRKNMAFLCLNKIGTESENSGCTNHFCSGQKVAIAI